MTNLQRVLLTAFMAVNIVFYIDAQKHDYYWVSGYSESDVTNDFGGSDIDFNVWPPKKIFLEAVLKPVKASQH